MERGLAAHGFDVLSVGDGESGIERALGADVDLVVLDLMLPGRSGLEVLERAPGGQAGAAGDRAHCAGRGRAARRRPRRGRGRLHRQAVLAVRARRPDPRPAAGRPSQAPQTTLSAGGIEVNLITREVRRDGDCVRLSTTEFELLVVSDAQPRSGPLTRADPARRVGIRVRPGHERRRRVRRVSAPQARGAAARGRRSSRSAPSATASMRRRSAVLPAGLRWRLTAWVAAVMVVSAAAVFVVVYQDTGRSSAARSTGTSPATGEPALSGAAPVRRRLAAQSSPTRRHGTCARSRTRRNSTLLFVLIPGRRDGQQPPGGVRRLGTPEPGETVAEQAARERAGRRC